MTTPFRERPPMLACPRCGEILNQVTGQVSMCAQCGGLWLGQPAIVSAFKDPTWPHGVGMWWRRELFCPVCAMGGIDHTMAAVVVGDLLLDRCIDHGLWFDRGELARLVGGSAAKELDMIKKVLESAKTPEWVIADQQKREQRELEVRRAEAAAREKRDAEEKAARDEEVLRARNAQLHIELTNERSELERQADEIVGRLAAMRQTIHADEQRLVELRARLRIVESQLGSLA
jgi:Zn-finger nucleic acid-binding protein